MNTNNNDFYEGGYDEAHAAVIIEPLKTLAAAPVAASELLIAEEQEQESLFQISDHQHECGHRCYGVQGESLNMPCLHEECIEAAAESEASHVPQSCAHSELCGICYTSELGEEACVRLSCGHVFHANCIGMLLQHKQSTIRITFGYLDCPSCKAEMAIDYYVPILSDLLSTELAYKRRITQLAIETAKKEGHDKTGRVVTPGDAYFGQLEAYAMHFCTFYECNDCKEPYFGGMQDCEQAMQSEDKTRKEDLLCKSCAWKALGLGSNMCEKHGNEFIDFKCMYCCSIGLFVCCKGRYYFCQPCHNDIMNGGKHKARTDCTGGPGCPLGIPCHPKADDDPKKSAFAIGCSLCRSEKLALISQNDQATNGVNIEKREDMVKRFDHVKGHEIQREVHIVKMGPAKESYGLHHENHQKNA